MEDCSREINLTKGKINDACFKGIVKEEYLLTILE